jgi:uncharacterized membrane protein (DUF4010 family)
MVQKDHAADRARRAAGAAARTGFFFGLAFEEIYKRDEPTIPGGIRTFPLVGLAGAMLYLVEPQRTVAFVAGLLALGAWPYAFIRLEQSREGGSGGTLVIPVSNLLVYVLGPIVLLQPPWVAVGVTVSAVLVIGTRERMHGFVRLIPQDEVLTAGKFLILVGIILPLVPDTRLIATAAVTPYHIWLAVVAISGLSYLTYLIQRYLPIKGGALLPALLGGAYSSTATTVVLAKRQREAATRRPELSAGIVAATAIMYPRLAAVVAFFNLPLAVALLPAVAFLFIVGAAAAWREWRKIEPGAAEDLAVPAANPLQLTTALIFAALFMAVSLVTGWVEAVFGQTGVFTLAVLVGASDIDPFVLNLAQGGVPNMPLSAVAAAVLIAGSANNLAKAGYAIGFGGPAAAEQPANALAVLALLGFATAAVYIL